MLTRIPAVIGDEYRWLGVFGDEVVFRDDRVTVTRHDGSSDTAVRGVGAMFVTPEYRPLPDHGRNVSYDPTRARDRGLVMSADGRIVEQVFVTYPLAPAGKIAKPDVWRHVADGSAIHTVLRHPTGFEDEPMLRTDFHRMDSFATVMARSATATAETGETFDSAPIAVARSLADQWTGLQAPNAACLNRIGTGLHLAALEHVVLVLQAAVDMRHGTDDEVDALTRMLIGYEDEPGKAVIWPTGFEADDVELFPALAQQYRGEADLPPRVVKRSR